MNNYYFPDPSSGPGPGFIFDDGGHRPFHKRHPVLFVLIIFVVACILMGIAFWGCMRTVLDDETMNALYSGKQLGVVNVEGVIFDSADVLSWIQKLEENENVVGVLVRINSPGGAVTPSEEIYFALERLAAKKPVVASMGALAASGGYMAALPAHCIVAAPSSITGSIGTRMDMANWEELMGKIGIKDQSLTSGEMKDAGSPYRDMEAKERAYFMGLLTDMHERFKEMVAKHRSLDPEVLNKVADGRAFTGRQALELGLVDSLGDKHAALEMLNGLTLNEAAGNVLLEGPPKQYSLFEELFESMFRAWNAAKIRADARQPLFYF
ncbi:MAG: signal peptide peptidase SppA [Desulfovibrionaceae bacterium]|nr:signal peptide peptidase SppA [Desulfovibrionaceae bacterium]